jgi:hypothetical protein
MVPFMPTRLDQIELIGRLIHRADNCRLWLDRTGPGPP